MKRRKYQTTTLCLCASVRYLLSNLILSSLLLLVISCNTFSPIAHGSGASAEFAFVEAVEAEWRAFDDGIDYFHGKIISPKLEFWALRVNLASPQIRIVIKDGMAANGGALSAKVTTFVRDNNLIAGINAAPFDVSSLKEKQPIQNMGIVISDGKLLAPANPRYDAIIFYRDNEQIKAAIISQAAIQTYPANSPAENIENAIGGFHQILAGGEPTERTLPAAKFPAQEAAVTSSAAQPVSAQRHPRSAAGVSANGGSLYLLVIDGRRAGSVGATERETALLLLSLGAWDGLNLDGGGSSALALRGRNGKVMAVNTPVQKGLVGVERAVAGCVGVRVEEERR